MDFSKFELWAICLSQQTGVVAVVRFIGTVFSNITINKITINKNIINKIIIMITRPKPAYGQQGLAGSWGQDTDGVSTFLVFLTSHFPLATLSSDLTNQGPLMTMKIHLETLKKHGNQPKTMKNHETTLKNHRNQPKTMEPP